MKTMMNTVKKNDFEPWNVTIFPPIFILCQLFPLIFLHLAKYCNNKEIKFYMDKVCGSMKNSMSDLLNEIIYF